MCFSMAKLEKFLAENNFKTINDIYVGTHYETTFIGYDNKTFKIYFSYNADGKSIGLDMVENGLKTIIEDKQIKVENIIDTLESIFSLFK